VVCASVDIAAGKTGGRSPMVMTGASRIGKV
jgi:hypothetical protein